MSEYKYTLEDLAAMQAWPLERKIQVSQTRFIEWKQHFDGRIYISFSGGKDSTVLCDLAARVYKAEKDMNGTVDPLRLMFVNTGLEYPECRSFVKTFAQWLRDTYDIPVQLDICQPDMKFPEVLAEYGYPVVTKELSQTVAMLRRPDLPDDTRQTTEEWVERYPFRKEMVHKLLDAPFLCSAQCCHVMKQGPADRYAEQTNSVPVIANLASESSVRRRNWLREGCNAFKRYKASTPMAFWLEQDVLLYLKTFNIPYLKELYGDIVEGEILGRPEGAPAEKGLVTTELSRTGCMFCMFGIMFDEEPNRFQQMHKTHPRQYEYCIRGGSYGEDGMLRPDADGLGLGKVLDYLGRPY